MPQFFSVQTDAPLQFELKPGQKQEMGFTVTNNQVQYRNIGFRVAVLNAIGEENRDAPEVSWFQVTAQPDSLVPAGGQTSCSLLLDVPPAVQPGRSLDFKLVAYDGDLGDEVKNTSDQFTVKVVGEVQEVEPDPVEERKIPFWVWIPGGVLMLLALIFIIGGLGDTDDWLAPGFFLFGPTVIGFCIASGVLGRKSLPPSATRWNYGWLALGVSVPCIVFEIAMLIFFISETRRGSDVWQIVLGLALVGLAGLSTWLATRVIQRNKV